LKKVMVLFFLALACTPLMAQLYSYRDAEGRLHITDRPINQKGMTHLKTYIPKDRRPAPADDNGLAERDALTGRSKYRLSQGQLKGLVDPIARSMEVDPELVHAVILVETGGDPYAKSHKGAMGLMQLIPATAERFGVDKPYDPRQNIKGGIRYLQYLLSYFEGNVDFVLAAYNAGENAVDKHSGIPPYKETRNYVRKVRKIYKPVTLPFGDMAKKKSKLVVGSAEVAQVASAE